METRSKSKLATAAEQPESSQRNTEIQAQEESVVSLNWLFVDKSKPDNCRPRSIDVRRSLFGARSQKCRSLFVTELLNEFKFEALETSITFWKPKGPLSLEAPVQSGWIEGISNIMDSFDFVPLPRSFAKALAAQIHNEDVVHLVVTAEGTYQRVAAVEEYDAGGDVATELPEVHRYLKIVSTPGQAPSDGAKSREYARVQAREHEAIHDGRLPPNPQFATVAPPIQIFHPIFDSFVQFANDPAVQPTNDVLRLTQGFMHLLSFIGTQETTRNADIRRKLTEILGFDVRDEPNIDKSSADGVHVFVVNSMRLPLLIMELKRELGDGGCDPSAQVGLTMRRSWLQDDRKGIRDKCCCPTLMLAGGGPWMGVLGGVFTDKIIVQRLTDMMWVGHSSTEEDARVYHFARVLNALRMSIKQLQDYYEWIDAASNLSFNPGHTHPRFYPYPTSYTDENGQLVHFEYLEALEKNEPTCVTYKAKSSAGEFIVVKFVSRYNPEVHKFLADKGHAPRLRYYGQLCNAPGLLLEPLATSAPPGVSLDPVQMVVMDHVFKCEQTPADAHQQLTAILKMLHIEGYVLGDLRRPNVLFNEQNKAILIDLDWSGPFDMRISDIPDSLPDELQKKINAASLAKKSDWPGDSYVRYPLNLSKSVTCIGVEDLDPIRPCHDWAMLHKHFPGVLTAT